MKQNIFSISHSDKLVEAAKVFDFSTSGRTLVALATFARPSGNNWVSQVSKAKLAELVDVSERTIQSALSLLESSGLITITRRLARTNLVTFNIQTILRPTALVMQKLAGYAVEMTIELNARLTQSVERRAAVKARYASKDLKPANEQSPAPAPAPAQERKPASPRQETPLPDQSADRGEAKDLPINDPFNLKRSDQHATARESSPSSQPVISKSALRMQIDSAIFQIKRAITGVPVQKVLGLQAILDGYAELRDTLLTSRNNDLQRSLRELALAAQGVLPVLNTL